MGGNGSFEARSTDTEAGRNYMTVFAIGDNVMVLQQKDPRKGVKQPEESHTPNRIYATFRKDGKDVKSIAQYGDDGKKLWEIHTNDHHGLKPHYHVWKDGRPVSVHTLTEGMKELLDRIRNFKV